MEQDRDGLSVRATDTTGTSAGVGRNSLLSPNISTSAANNFLSSPLMVQLNFLIRYLEKGSVFRATIEPDS
jgi:hypothetical protein